MSTRRFLEKHDERMIEENRFLRAKADEKYRRTHDYNLIAGAYYDDKKERDFVQSRDKLGTLQGRAQQDRLPPSVRFGEGNDYDIINKLVRPPTKSHSLKGGIHKHCTIVVVPPSFVPSPECC